MKPLQLHNITLPAEDIDNLHWMARRYADGRSTYAPLMMNEITRRILSTGMELNAQVCDGTVWATDGMADKGYMSGLSIEDQHAAQKSASHKLHAVVCELYELKRNGLLTDIQLKRLLELAGVNEE